MAQLNGDAGSSSPLFPDRKAGVWGQSDDGYGVAGTANQGNGLQGGSISGFGAVGTSDENFGVLGISTKSAGVHGRSESDFGVFGESNEQIGVVGKGRRGGVEGICDQGIGVFGNCNSEDGLGIRGVGGYKGVGGEGNSIGVHGNGGDTGVKGEGQEVGVSGTAANVGIYAHNTDVNGHDAYLATRCCAGDFYGDVFVHGKLTKQGGSFKIDHPLDPANKYLSHAFVESPDMKNIYDGVAVTDAKGDAVIDLPAWFETLNKDIRYQLTPIGAAGPNLHIAEELFHNRFRIAGGTPGMKVSWMVTGIRKDPWAKAHRIQVEEEKPANECGYYLNPELYNQPAEKGLMRVRYPSSGT